MTHCVMICGVCEREGPTTVSDQAGRQAGCGGTAERLSGGRGRCTGYGYAGRQPLTTRARFLSRTTVQVLAARLPQPLPRGAGAERGVQRVAALAALAAHPALHVAGLRPRPPRHARARAGAGARAQGSAGAAGTVVGLGRPACRPCRTMHQPPTQPTHRIRSCRF
jgi:hypothetical protein